MDSHSISLGIGLAERPRSDPLFSLYSDYQAGLSETTISHILKLPLLYGIEGCIRIWK